MQELTVLMTTYNETQEVVKIAIESILKQTYRNFNFLIIIDNPNNKKVVEIVDKFSKQDARITYVINENNLGLPLALNKGIKMVNTQYLARMDADDIADPKRLEKEIDFLKKHSQIGLVGTNVQYIDVNGNCLYKRGRIPSKTKQIEKIMRYVNVFNHPTFMGKTEIFKDFEYRNLRYAQDYDFVCRLIERKVAVANIDEYLLSYRKNNIVSPEKKIRQRITLHCIQEAFRRKRLNCLDIELEVNKRILKINKKEWFQDMESYDYVMDLIRETKYIKAILKIVVLIKKSKLCRKEFYNLLVYGVLKRIYHF